MIRSVKPERELERFVTVRPPTNRCGRRGRRE
jgi:hypothetical protein